MERYHCTRPCLTVGFANPWGTRLLHIQLSCHCRTWGKFSNISLFPDHSPAHLDILLATLVPAQTDIYWQHLFLTRTLGTNLCGEIMTFDDLKAVSTISYVISALYPHAGLLPHSCLSSCNFF